MKYLTFICFLIAFPVSASELTDDQATKELVWQVLNIVDYGTTRDIYKRCSQERPDDPVIYREKNPLLGECPSSANISRHFLIGAIGHYAITKNLGEYRDVWLDTTIVVAFVFAYNNVSLGLHVNF